MWTCWWSAWARRAFPRRRPQPKPSRQRAFRSACWPLKSPAVTAARALLRANRCPSTRPGISCSITTARTTWTTTSCSRPGPNMSKATRRWRSSRRSCKIPARRPTGSTMTTASCSTTPPAASAPTPTAASSSMFPSPRPRKGATTAWTFPPARTRWWTSIISASSRTM